MSDCGRFEEGLRALVAGESGVDARALAQHAEACSDCHELLSAHETLTELAAEMRVAEPAGLDELRGRVLDEVRLGRTRTRPAALFAPFALRFAPAALAALLLFCAGFAAAWLRTDTRAPEAATLVGELTSEAISNRSLLDVEDSRFTYSDVSFRRLDGGQVALEFDVTRHVRLTEDARSPLVQEVLAQSLLNPSHTGSRLKALALATEGMAPKVRESLVFALHHDENLAVRRKALQILATGPPDAAIESAVLTTLREDDSVQMRLEALDYLAAHLEPAAIRRAIGDSGAPGNAALIVRLGEYEK